MSDTRGPEFEPEEGAPAAPKETQDFFVATEPGEVIGEEAERPRARLLPMWILLAAVILVGVAWAISDRYFGAGGEGDDSVPLVVADDTPVKVRPDEPGGVDVPDRDKYVYKSLTEEDAVETEAEAEQLAPPPEEPMQRPPVEGTEIEAPDESMAELVDETPDAPQQADQEDMMPDVESASESASESAANFAKNTAREAAEAAQGEASETVSPQPEQLLASPVEAEEAEVVEAAPDVPATEFVEEVAEEAAPVIAAVEPEPAPEPTPEPKAEPATEAKTKAAAAPKQKATVRAGNPAFMVQIGASQNEKAAGESLARLAKKHPKILGSLDVVVVRADLGDKGVWYRMRVGPFAARGDAGTVCGQLKAVDVGCFVVAN